MMDEECEIVEFIHCAMCLDELPHGLSPREWARTQSGFLADGSFQVWCNRHNAPVVTFNADQEDKH